MNSPQSDRGEVFDEQTAKRSITKSQPKPLEKVDALETNWKAAIQIMDVVSAERNSLRAELQKEKQINIALSLKSNSDAKEIELLKAELQNAKPAIDFCAGAFAETFTLLSQSGFPLKYLCEENQRLREENNHLQSHIEDITH